MKKGISYTVSTLFFLLVLFIGTRGEHYLTNYLNLGTFTGEIKGSDFKDYRFQSLNGETIQLSSFKGKRVILDCWNTKCGSCIRAMPKLEEFYKRAKKNEDVYVASLLVLCPGETENRGREIIKKNGYTFPVWVIERSHKLIKDQNINVFPTFLIFDKEGKVEFHGIEALFEMKYKNILQ
jgi:thiol-disulfide isomerase/thioredoxin